MFLILQTDEPMLIFTYVANQIFKPAFAGLFLFVILVMSLGVHSNAHAQTVIEKQTKAQANEGAEVEKARMTGFHVVGSDDTVRLVFDVTRTVDAETLVLSAPYRLVIDLPDTEFALKDKRNSASPGFLKKVSFGTTKDNLARLVIETGVPFAIEKKFIVSEAYGEGKRLVFDLKKSSEKEFRITVLGQAEERRLAKEEAERRAQELALSTTENGTEPAKKEDKIKPLIKKRVVLDPGHGGKDGGAKTVAGVLEKDIVLSFSKKLAKELEATGEFEVTLTRNGDEFIRLSERVAIARDNKADLFVSIHADSLPNDRSVRGTAVYTISERASDEMAASIAAEQNKSDAIAGHEIIDGPDEVIDILFDLTRRETSNLSIVFARHFYNNMQSQIRFFKRPLQRGAFTVLRVPDIPSVLIELGFLSNAQDAKQLSNDDWRQDSAAKMAITIAEYFEKPVIGFNQ